VLITHLVAYNVAKMVVRLEDAGNRRQEETQAEQQRSRDMKMKDVVRYEGEAYSRRKLRKPRSCNDIKARGLARGCM
jgi:hypothetical protein